MDFSGLKIYHCGVLREIIKNFFNSVLFSNEFYFSNLLINLNLVLSRIYRICLFITTEKIFKRCAPCAVQQQRFTPRKHATSLKEIPLNSTFIQFMKNILMNMQNLFQIKNPNVPQNHLPFLKFWNSKTTDICYHFLSFWAAFRFHILSLHNVYVFPFIRQSFIYSQRIKTHVHSLSSQ